MSNTWQSQEMPKPSLKSGSTNFPRIRRLSIVSWNIDAVSESPVLRAKCILERILKHPPDVIFFQEVKPAVRESLLDDPSVQEAFLTTDAEDEAAFEVAPFATMALLSRARFPSPDYPSPRNPLALGSVARVNLRSIVSPRDALCIDVFVPPWPHTAVRLINVHFEPFENRLFFREKQMEGVAQILREPGCSAGVVAGDFNAIGPKDDALVEEHGLVDAWLTSRVHMTQAGNPDGYTWGVDAALRNVCATGRLDKVALLGLKASYIEVLQPGTVWVPGQGNVPWSDHCGLRCTVLI